MAAEKESKGSVVGRLANWVFPVRETGQVMRESRQRAANIASVVKAVRTGRAPADRYEEIVSAEDVARILKGIRRVWWIGVGVIAVAIGYLSLMAWVSHGVFSALGVMLAFVVLMLSGLRNVVIAAMDAHTVRTGQRLAWSSFFRNPGHWIPY